MGRLFLTLVALAAAAVGLPAPAAGQECDAEGICVGQTSGPAFPASDAQECADACADDPACAYYTYDDGSCTPFATCPAVDPGSCPDCVSGESDCGGGDDSGGGAPTGCGEPGACVGLLVGDLPAAGGASNCSDACNADEFCLFFTVYEGSGDCQLFYTCDLDAAAEGCSTSVRGCSGDGELGKELDVAARHFPDFD